MAFSWHEICTLCFCHEDLNCDAPLELIGNGFCNDESNNEGCIYDGGDCCGACVKTEQCRECVCHEGGESASDFSCKLFFQDVPKIILIVYCCKHT